MARAKKKFDPYDVLGVERSATPGDIKSAHRRRAKATHPDHGGDRQAFEDVTLANVVLSDQGKRAKFDATGEMDADAAANPDAAAFGIIGQLIAQALEQEPDPLKMRVVDVLRQVIGDAVHKIDAEVTKHKRSKLRAEKMRERFKRRNPDGENMMARAMDWQIRNLNERLRGPEMALANHKRALEILRDYDFQNDPPDAYPMAGFQFSSSSTFAR